MLDRNELIEEQTLRRVIRKLIVKSQKTEQAREILEEQKLRGIVRKMILLEKTPVGDEAPHESTGINILRNTLKNIIPSIKDSYMSLTTSPEQRKSYIAHLINGIDNILAPIEINLDAPEPSPAIKEDILDEDIDVDIGSEEDFIDFPGSETLVPDEEKEEEEPELDDDEDLVTRGMENSVENDETGRNVAIGTFKQIQNSIIDDFGDLANDDDREIYHDYIKTNILLWKDKFEKLLTKASDLPEPTTPEYEKGKEHIAQGDQGEQIFEIIDI
tara:strand:- start:17 stop:835 length:819 start_codon:yes stop_codon:yes gene_type:complete